MTWFLATSRDDARRMAILGRLRSLTERDGRPCRCAPFVRLYPSPGLAAAHPNAFPVEITLSVDGPWGAGEWRTAPLPWVAPEDVRRAVGLAG